MLFLVPGVSYPEPFDLDAVKATLPRDQWPRMRTYTVRHHDPEAGELTLDILVHGDKGLGGPWAAQARPGDQVLLRGPGGAYAPRADVDHHLLVGDESALPAIAASLEALAPDATATVRLLVEDPAEQQSLSTKRRRTSGGRIASTVLTSSGHGGSTSVRARCRRSSTAGGHGPVCAVTCCGTDSTRNCVVRLLASGTERRGLA